jgi:hypothetical protein
VIVEGRRDAGLFRWYLREHSLNASVFAIDDRVRLPRDPVIAAQQQVNSRGRAITAAIHAERRLGKEQRSVTVIVDADALRVLGPAPREASCLLWTDDAALENYVLRERPLAKALDVCLHSAVDAATVLTAIRPALADVWSVRLVLNDFDLPLIDDFAAVCELSEFRSSADVEELIRRSLTGVAKAEWPASVADLAAMAKQVRGFILASGQTGRGHDIAPLIRGFLETQGRLVRPEMLEIAVVSCLELVDLDEEPLFRMLRSRLSEVTLVV